MKNEYETNEEKTIIFLSRKDKTSKTIIDTRDLPYLLNIDIAWYSYYNASSKSCYVKGKYNKKYVSLHRIIMKCPPQLVIDHINHDTLDNRRKNLRVSTNRLNQQNRLNARSDSESKERNIMLNKRTGKYEIKMTIKNKIRKYRESFLLIDDAIEKAEELRAKYYPHSQEAMLASQ
jgi:hypothetical protein